jgi:hypothetical protein
MKTRRILSYLVPGLFFVTATQAAITKSETTQLDFKGSFGAVMKFFGGEGMKYSVEYMDDDLYRRDTLDKKGKKVEESEIIDLQNEVFIRIDHKKKRYSKMTFAEWREMVESSMQQMKQSGTRQKEDDDSSDKPKTDVKWSFTIDVDRPGETKSIAGKNTEKVVLNLNVEAEATQEATEDQEAQKAKGGLKVTSTNWLYKDSAVQKEMQEFYSRMAEKLGIMPGKSGMAGVFTQIMENNPQLGGAIQKMQEESEKFDGITMSSHVVYETWGESDQPQQEEEQKTEIPKGLGGLVGGFMKKKAQSSDSDSSVLLESHSNLDNLSTGPVDPKVFLIPEKYKEEKYKK